MNSNTNSDKKKEKDQKINNKKKIDEEKNSKNFFRVMKEIEKEEKNKEGEIKNNKLTSYNLTERIYLTNIEKLGNYYKKNKNILKLYGSKKFDDLTIQKLVEEMRKYKSKVVKKIKENKNEKAGKNFGFESCDEKVILTPLASREKENKNITDTIEKKNFDDVERTGVVMRRIEYMHLLDNREGYKKVDTEEEDKKFIMLIIEAIDKIERNWLIYKLRKLKKEEEERKERERKEREKREKERKEREEKERKEREEKERREKERKEREKKEKEERERREKEKEKKEKEKEKERKEREKREKEEKEKREKEIEEKIKKEKEQKEKVEKDEDKINIEIKEENIDKINESNNPKIKDNIIKLRNKFPNSNKNKNEILTKNNEINFMILNQIKKDISINNKLDLLIKENFSIQILLNKQKLNNNNDEDIQNIKFIYKQNKPCFITKILGKISSSDKLKLNEAKNNYFKIKSQLDIANLENKKLNNQIKEMNDDIKKLDEEILENKKEKEKLIKNNKEINNKLNLSNTENEQLRQKYNLLDEKYKELLDNFNQLKNELNDEINNNKNLKNEISKLNDIKNEQNTNNKNMNNELENIKDNLKNMINEKEKKDEELENIKSDLEQKIITINSYEKEIDNLKTQILEKDKINETNSEINNKNLLEYQNKISLLEKEKQEIQNTNNILEEISNSNKDKYSKLFYKNKNDINKRNKEKESLNNEIILLKRKLDDLKKNEEKEKNENLNVINVKDKYEKKIMNLNKLISELKKRIQDLYLQLSFLQKNTLINNNSSDIFIRLKLMILLIKICIDKKTIFDKREFFNILFKKYKNKYSSREKRIEFLREYNKVNGFPY